MTDYIFVANSKEFKISLTRRNLYLIPEAKNALFDALSSRHRYVVQSRVSNNTFESFLDYWTKDEPPQITENNFFEYYQLDDEFGILTEILDQPQYKQFNDVNILIRFPDDKTKDNSLIEKRISQDLDQYLTNSSNSMKRISINSLYNIFNNPERNLNDHDLAYRFIIDAAAEGNELFYILLESLDSDKMKSAENRRDSIVNFRKHQKFVPQNSEKFILELEKKLENIVQEDLERANQKIKTLTEEKEELSNKLKEQQTKNSNNNNNNNTNNRSYERILPNSPNSSNNNNTNSNNRSYERILPNSPNSSNNNTNSNNHSYERTLPSSPTSSSTSSSNNTNSNNHSYERILPNSPNSSNNNNSSNHSYERNLPSSNDNSSNNHSYYRTLPNSPNSNNSNNSNNHSYYRELPSSTPPSKMEQILSKARDGDLNSQFQAGLSYLKGFNGFTKDPTKALPFIKKAADRQHPEASMLLAKILLNTNNYPEAVHYLEIAVKSNNEEALITYGEILCTGDHVKLDLARGVNLLQRAMKTVSDVKSLMVIGYRFYKIHTQSLLVDARKCFKNGASLNHPPAIFNYGYMLERGEGGDQDVKKAVELYIKAANLNSVTAIIHLGEMFEEGKYMDSPNLDKAMEFYIKAKNLGSIEAIRAIERVKMRKRRETVTGFRRFDEGDLLIGMMLRDFLDL